MNLFKKKSSRVVRATPDARSTLRHLEEVKDKRLERIRETIGLLELGRYSEPLLQTIDGPDDMLESKCKTYSSSIFNKEKKSDFQVVWCFDPNDPQTVVVLLIFID